MDYRTYQKSIVFIIILTFTFSLSSAQTVKEGLSPLDVAKLKQVNEIAISVTGDTAAYTLQVQEDPMKKNESAKNHLYVMPISEGKSLPYVTSMSVRNIEFRPDHNSITFLSSRTTDEPAALYEISLSGGEPKELFTFHESISNYTWAPDGNHLAFTASDTNDSKSKLPYQPEIYEENLSQIYGYVTNLETENHKWHRLDIDGSIYHMKWHPGGEKLAISVAPTPLVDDYYMNQDIQIVDHKGKVLASVDHEGKLGKFDWNPDGSQLAMLAAADVHDPIAGRLFVVDENGGTPTQLQPDYKGKFEDFKWVSNNTLHYITSEGVWSTYGAIDADGSEMQTIVDRGGPNLDSFDQAEEGLTIFAAHSSLHPRELFVLKDKERTLRRLTNSNSWLDEIELGRQSAVSWQAEDGMELQGVLIYPLNYEKGKKYPLITTVHGGPESHYENGWLTNYSDPGQVASAEGYFVFYPNYRGSTGRGEEFAKSSQGDMAGAEFDDIIAGIDELIDVGLVDSASVGVTGGSYGGYATGWFSTRYTDRFAAGVMFVGISNNISKWGTSDIPEELFLVHSRQRIWDDYQSFLERSPIYHAGQAKTPLLIAAGKEDTRVDPSQSYELYRHLKTRTDTPVRLVLYPGEGHGNRQSTARLDYNLRMMRWFNKFLKESSKELPDFDFDKELLVD